MTTQDTIGSINRALRMAEDNDIEVVELWLGPPQWDSLTQPDNTATPDVTTDEKDYSYFRGLRLRKMADEGVRAGQTTCEWGPGVT